MRAGGPAGGEEDTINNEKEKVSGGDRGRGPGILFLVGIGPGDVRHMTGAALAAIHSSHAVVGYTAYVSHISDMLKGKEVVTSGMGKELERVRRAIELVRQGKRVSLVSSGDPGVYGMAGPALEVLAKEGGDLQVEVIPGVTAANSAAAIMGAPLMMDYASISLSDLLVPWEDILKRLEAVAASDMVTALYNPKSRKRIDQIEQARRIFLKYRSPQTPVGIATDVGGDQQSVVISDLERFTNCSMNMRSLVIVGNSTTFESEGFMVTPRGYKI